MIGKGRILLRHLHHKASVLDLRPDESCNVQVNIRRPAPVLFIPRYFVGEGEPRTVLRITDAAGNAEGQDKQVNETGVMKNKRRFKFLSSYLKDETDNSLRIGAK